MDIHKNSLEEAQLQDSLWGGKYTSKLIRPLSYSLLEVLNIFTGHQAKWEKNPASPAYARLEIEESSAFFSYLLSKN